MKVTRKMKDEFRVLKPSENEEIAPGLSLRELPKAIEGLEAGHEFEATCKGKCKGHEVRSDRDGKETHHYDLDIHEFQHKGGGGSSKNSHPRKTSREQVEDAMDKHDRDRERDRARVKEAEKVTSTK